eukprot:TRINITY_DN50931_c0_g1_i1.p1 TRINITY_DN50931_c0_g1~~TRINITY_DN50931_c0_g1_i1.p1  ORF type:complete len:316 (+),score=38.88 TRINITY_DN50931_c0_g1_i1:92-1039(+)
MLRPLQLTPGPAAAADTAQSAEVQRIPSTPTAVSALGSNTESGEFGGIPATPMGAYSRPVVHIPATPADAFPRPSACGGLASGLIPSTPADAFARGPGRQQATIPATPAEAFKKQQGFGAGYLPATPADALARPQQNTIPATPQFQLRSGVGTIPATPVGASPGTPGACGSIPATPARMVQSLQAQQRGRSGLSTPAYPSAPQQMMYAQVARAPKPVVPMFSDGSSADLRHAPKRKEKDVNEGNAAKKRSNRPTPGFLPVAAPVLGGPKDVPEDESFAEWKKSHGLAAARRAVQAKSKSARSGTRVSSSRAEKTK